MYVRNEFILSPLHGIFLFCIALNLVTTLAINSGAVDHICIVRSTVEIFKTVEIIFLVTNKF